MSRCVLMLSIAAFVTVSCGKQETSEVSEPAESPATAGPGAAAAGGRPVLIGGEAQLDACAASGLVSGMDPAGDNFLAVRIGPGTQFAESDRLEAGQPVNVCEEDGEWLGLVYDKEGANCGLSSPQERRTPYAGPCRSGWVAARFVTIIAG